MKQTSRYNQVEHCYEGTGTPDTSRGKCRIRGCENFADYPSEFNQDGRKFYVCYVCEDWWYHIGARQHPEEYPCGHSALSICDRARMELKQ